MPPSLSPSLSLPLSWSQPLSLPLSLSASEPLPHGRSQWDRLPYEMKALVAKHAGPLTQCILGFVTIDCPTATTSTTASITTTTTSTKTTTSQAAGIRTAPPARTVRLLDVWLDAARIDWHGDLRLLPDLDSKSHAQVLALVHSRSMYYRMCARFPSPTMATARYLSAIPTPDGAKDDDGDDANQDTAWQYGINAYDSPRSCISDHRRAVAVRHGWFDLLDFRFPIALGWYAIQFGNAALLRHLAHDLHLVDLSLFKRLRLPMSDASGALDIAASRGHVDVLRVLHDGGNQACTKFAMDLAAAFGHLDAVVWLHEHRTEGCTTRAMNWAARNGFLAVVQWLHEHRTEGCTTDAINHAAEAGHLDVVQWLSSHRHEGATTDAVDKACAMGHLAVADWLLANRHEGCTPFAMQWAAGNGHLAVVEYIHARHHAKCCAAVFVSRAIAQAATAGHLAVFTFLVDTHPGVMTEIDFVRMATFASVQAVQYLMASLQAHSSSSSSSRSASATGSSTVKPEWIAKGIKAVSGRPHKHQDDMVAYLQQQQLSLAH